MCQYTGVPWAWLLDHSILFYFLCKASLEMTIHLLVYLLSASHTGSRLHEAQTMFTSSVPKQSLEHRKSQ